MKSKDEFYIGWQDQETKGYRRVFLLFFGLAILVILGFAILFTSAERGFINSYFDYGNLTEMEGQLVLEPFPGLRTAQGGQVVTVPLVGFGKFGAESAIAGLHEKLKGELGAFKVKIRGTVFEYRGKKWMELTEGPNSLISFTKHSETPRRIAALGTKTFAGEIIDPKCFFGVMNPATKAVHRSCAIRCISGGVPAILGIRENGEFVDYYFLVDQNQQKVGKEILPYVGIPMAIKGEVSHFDDWKTLTWTAANSTALALNPSALAWCE